MKAKRILASVLSVALLLQLSPLGVLALDESLPQTPQVSTVQENLDPAPTEEPALVEEPAPTAEPTPTAAPTTEPTAEPTATPAAEASAPDAAATPAPEPSAEPTAAPDPVAEVQAMIDALPDEVTEDNAEAVEQALTDIDDAKESLTDDELAGLDLTRYDAAANALLALWGEATTDAVETLDNYPRPSIDATDSYYQIYNEGELRWFAEHVNSGDTSSNARLMNDITLDKTTQWTPIGTDADGMRFTGTFDGQNHTITGLYIDGTEDYVGLFGCIGKNGLATGTVKNVILADVHVSGRYYVGGVCGYNYGTLKNNSNNNGTVTVTDTGSHAGGICGYNDGGTVEDCTSGCTVSGKHYTGGICGSNGGQSSALGYIRNCHNTGAVTSTGYHIGGVCGRNYGKLQNCHNAGDVTGTGGFYAAGVCGYNGYNSNGTNIVEKSYNVGKVSGGTSVGGVCGYNNRNVKESYNIGTVTSTTGKNVAGVCGENYTSAHVQDCYYLDTSETHAGGGISKTLAEFNSGEVAYLLQKAINDAADKAGTTAEQVWGQNIGTDPYPVLGGKTVYYNDTNKYHNHDDNTECEGCAPKPTTKTDTDGKTWYIITTPDELKWFAKWVNGGHTDANAKLENSITLNQDVLTGEGELNGIAHDPWTPIGTNTDPFTGTFDGNNKTISGLYIDGNTSNVGLFGCVGKSSTATGIVQNVTLADSYVRGNEFVGGICGYNKGGTLQDCHNTGTVSGTTNVGGVCGKNDSGTVDGCYNSGTVSAKYYVGGVCGLNNNGSTLEKSYNTGKVSCTNDHVGGVCGLNDASTVQGCYNTGTVSGKEDVGGVCGENIGGGTVQECYNTVTVSGTRNVGGVCGMNSSRGTAQGCYNTGKVSGNSYSGGVCGFSDGYYVSVKKCYYLVGTSENAVGNRGDDINCKSKTETEFKNGAVAYRLQSDLGGTTQVWGQRIGMDKTPVLSSDTTYKVYARATSPCKGGYSNTNDGTLEHNYVNGVCSNCGEWEEAKDVDGFYEIYNQGQLRWFAELVNKTASDSETKLNARLMKDITMDGTEWTPIGTSNEHPFKDTFDGNGKTITGLKCTDASKYYVGLVGYAVGATIQNVTVKDSSFNGDEYIGAVCGYIKNGGTITGCTNSGSAVSGNNHLGGIAGYAANSPVQRCFNSGAVTGQIGKFGGIVGKAEDATVQDCGNTGAVKEADVYETPAYYGGIVGLAEGDSTIENCYNADKNTAAPICGSEFCDLSNCYYLVDNPGSSGSTDPNITAKTQAQFASGEVAYLLQNGHGDTAVWGQTIGTDKYPQLGGEKVYQSTPCKIKYSNTGSETIEHVFGSDGICKNCGQPQIAYTVTIPASVELGNKATITADGVILPDDKQLNVKVADNSPFEVTLDGDTRTYTVTNVTDGGTEVKPGGNPVLTVVNGVAESSVELQFNKPESTTYSGTYTGTVTFTVSVDNKS